MFFDAVKCRIMKTKYQKPDFTESDIRHLAQAFDILLEGAIQNHLVDEHGRLAVAKKVSGGGDD